MKSNGILRAREEVMKENRKKKLAVSIAAVIIILFTAATAVCCGKNSDADSLSGSDIAEDSSLYDELSVSLESNKESLSLADSGSENIIESKNIDLFNNTSGISSIKSAAEENSSAEIDVNSKEETGSVYDGTSGSSPGTSGGSASDSGTAAGSTSGINTSGSSSVSENISGSNNSGANTAGSASGSSTATAQAPQQPVTQVYQTAAQSPQTTEAPKPAYNPNYVISETAKQLKALGYECIPEYLDRYLAEGRITQEEYNEWYPTDGAGWFETSLYNVTYGGTMEDDICELVENCKYLCVDNIFYIEYIGQNTYGGYTFRCYR